MLIFRILVVPLEAVLRKTNFRIVFCVWKLITWDSISEMSYQEQASGCALTPTYQHKRIDGILSFPFRTSLKDLFTRVVTRRGTGTIGGASTSLQTSQMLNRRSETAFFNNITLKNMMKIL